MANEQLTDVAKIVVLKNGLDSHPYNDYWSVDLRDGGGRFLARLGTYARESIAIRAAAEIAEKTGSVVERE